MKKRILYAACVFALGCSMLLPASAAQPTISDAKDKKEQLESQIDDVESQVAQLKEKSASTQEYVEQLDKQLAQLSQQLVEVQQQLEQKEAELEQTQADLEAANATKDKQYDDMKKRIKFMYESGNTAYLEMILNADDFTDMLNKAEYVKQISEYDRNMMTEYQNTINDIAAKEAQIEADLADIEQLKASVEKQSNSVEALRSTKQEEMDNYKKEIAKSEELQKQYQDELDEQDAIIAKLEEEAARKAAEEEAARKKAAEEAAKKKAAEDAKKAASTPDAGSSQTFASGGAGSTEGTSSGGWTWPLPGYSRVSSDYGYRTHPVTGVQNKMHYGIDLPAPAGTPIVAAKAGTVLAASYSSSMGNYVIVDHGSGISTVYMHCSGFATSAGAKVSAGQTIAYVGSTGSSTANHLHFSVRLNGSYVNPWNYISR